MGSVDAGAASLQSIDENGRDLFSRLLAPADRRRVLGLAGGPAPLKIQCLGPLSVTVGSEALDPKALRKRKCGSLLVLLLANEGPVPRDQVIDQLWPDLDAEAADTSLRVAFHHLRRLLEPHLGGRSRSRYIQSEGGLVWFSREPEVQVDMDQFRAGLAEAEAAVARGERAKAAARFEEACKAYRGDLAADDPYSDALEEFRRHLRERYTSALEWLGEYHWREAQDPPRAVVAFKQRLAVDAACEPAHQALMRIYLENGQVAAARMQYAVCREALAALGESPARATESLLQLALSMESESPPLAADSPPAPRRRSGA